MENFKYPKQSLTVDLSKEEEEEEEEWTIAKQTDIIIRRKWFIYWPNVVITRRKLRSFQTTAQNTVTTR
jgi:hypothetical protein